MPANDKTVGVLLMALGIVAAALLLWGGLVFYVWVEPILDAFLIRVLAGVFLLGIAAVLVGTVWFSLVFARSEWRQRALLAQCKIELSSHKCAGWAAQLRIWPAVAVLCALTVASLLIAVLPIDTYAFYVGLRWLVFCAALGLGWFWLRAGVESVYGSGDFVLVVSHHVV